ncbi:MAG TPA: MFS transporter [Syntrophobacteraceae bacterium]|nr:MFS transporter [Syntrophobacteraceae bacterium]
MAAPSEKPPARGWIVTFAGMAVNLCLGILYAWSVWGDKLTVPKLPDGKYDLAKVGTPLFAKGVPDTLNAGWTYLSNSDAATPFSLCVIIFACMMIGGGKIQDKFGPKVGATLGGLFLAAGCIIAGLMKSYTGLIIGFGVMGGIGMGIGYAAPTPAALKWFGPHKRGLIAGITVGGYGGAALYIAPLANWLIQNYGVSGSFIILGIFFAVVVIIAGQLLSWPPAGYVAPAPPPPKTAAPGKAAMTAVDWEASRMLGTWQYYALVVMFIGSTQSGLLIISSALGIGKGLLGAAMAWTLVSWGGLINASGRICTGLYSDKIGRTNAYTVNCLISAACLFTLPLILKSNSILLMFIAVGIAYWQYGGGLALMPSFTADFYGPKNLGFNYGLVFLGWGFGFFMAKIGGLIKDITGSLDYAFYLSALVLIIAVILARLTKRPRARPQTAPAMG